MFSWLFKQVLLGFAGFSFGMVAAAGVFTVFSTVSLLPRYEARFSLANKVLLCENVIIVGTVVGSLVQMLDHRFLLGDWLKSCFGELPLWWKGFAVFLEAFMGLFYGIFVGTLALSVAEMLDSIPIFLRRVRLKKGVFSMITAIAVGKLCGALLYFYYKFYE